MSDDRRASAPFLLLAGLMQLVGPLVLRIIAWTCRITILNRHVERSAMGPGRAIVGAFWHQTLFFPFIHFQRRRAAIMISRSRDGELASALSRGLGHVPVRGSSSSGGSDALREIVEFGRRGVHLALIVDGPKGPPRVAKIGVVVAARDSGLPILPVAARMIDPWVLRSWDRTTIPKPFSRMIAKFGEPIPVASDASREDCERIRQQVEGTLNGLEAELARIKP